ncbi:MAG: hypothetical protein HYZ53_04810 [Planctomycetes bacterium]|nr:hypothetical protein [Planctomycetota bacterium]
MNTLCKGGSAAAFAIAALLSVAAARSAADDPVKPAGRAVTPPPAPGGGALDEKDLSAEIHGGLVTATKEHVFEIAFHHDRIEVYLYDREQARASIQGAAGSVALVFRDKQRTGMHADLALVDTHFRDWLSARMDLSRIEHGAARAFVRLAGLPGKEETNVVLEVPFQIARIAKYVCAKDKVVADEPGYCPKCSSLLIRRRHYLGCALHPLVASEVVGDNCWKCGKLPLRLLEDKYPTLFGTGGRPPID